MTFGSLYKSKLLGHMSNTTVAGTWLHIHKKTDVRDLFFSKRRLTSVTGLTRQSCDTKRCLQQRKASYNCISRFYTSGTLERKGQLNTARRRTRLHNPKTTSVPHVPLVSSCRRMVATCNHREHQTRSMTSKGKIQGLHAFTP